MRSFIKIEISLGSTIQDAFHESKRIYGILGVGVIFDFNGVKMYYNGKDTIETFVETYHIRCVKS